MMQNERWAPHVTVATLVEKEGKFLLVEEQPDGYTHSVYNQPAGHLDNGESLINAAKRETLEETGWIVDITGFIGQYRFIAPNGFTYLRHGFIAKAISKVENAKLDTPIIQTHWLTYQEIEAKKTTLRSAMVMDLIDDYLAGQRYSLELFHNSH